MITKKVCKKSSINYKTLAGKYKEHARWTDAIVGDVTSPKVLAEMLAEAKAAKLKRPK